ncbi:MAG: apolipoprotein N-acyltransferase, partial [Cyanobacteria bacterium J06632_3]
MRPDIKSWRAALRARDAWLDKGRSAGILLGGGLLMGLAPVNAWPLAWVAMVPLWQLSSSAPSFRAALIGAGVWGIAYHGTALSWIVWWLEPLLAMGVPWFGGILLALFAWIFITLWGAAIGMTWMALLWGVTRWRPVSGWRRLLVGTALWCAVEWVWSKGPLYWTSLSYTQSPGNLWGLQWGQLSGPIGVTAAIVLVNGVLAESVLVKEGALKSKRTWIVIAIAMFLSFHLVGWGAYARPLQDIEARSLSVGLIQGNIPTSEKLTSAGVQKSRQAYLEGYEKLANEGAQLIVTPEGALPEPWNAFTQSRNFIMRAVVQRQVPLLLGTFAHKAIDDNQSPLAQSLLMLAP